MSSNQYLGIEIDILVKAIASEELILADLVNDLNNLTDQKNTLDDLIAKANGDFTVIAMGGTTQADVLTNEII